MTGLHRTPLTTSQKTQCAALALAGQEVHGTISEVSREFGISRPTVYEARNTAGEVLREHFEQEESAYRAVRVEVDDALLERAVVALRVKGPNAIRPIEELLPILYPGVRVSYGKIQSILVQAEEEAKAFNAKADLSPIKNSALDEMFSQGEPVLAGVDLASGYLFGLELREGRSGEDWAQVLGQAKAQGLDVSVVVKDAAKGIAAGMHEVFPGAEQRDDCFHVRYELNKVARQLEQRAYGAIGREEEVEKALAKIRAKDPTRRLRQKRKIARARRECQQAMARFDAFEAASAQVREAMEYVDLATGELRCAEEAHNRMAQAAQAIAGIDAPGCGKLAGYLANRAPGLSLATAALNTQLRELASAYPECAVALACLVWRLVSACKKRSAYWQRHENTRLLAGAYARLQSLLGSKTDTLLDTVKGLLDKRYRASSAIEGFNAALRPYLYVHKGVTQNFLELFRAHYNLRTRRWGRHKGTSAHECLTGTPVNDWLSLLGYPPTSTLH
jgi:hypothetical protein